MDKEMTGAELVEQVAIMGDLSKLSPAQRAKYYLRVCESLGVNPLTRPFEYIILNGRLTLYARRDATDQLRRLHGVSISIAARERVEDVYIVTAHATTPDGRTDEAIGAVSIAGLKGEALANAIMKAETKAKRRVTLSIVGLGWLDESEVEDIPEAQRPDPERESRAELPPAPTGSLPPKHWIENEEIRRRFWAWATNSLGLTREEVHAALGVKSVKEFGGTPQEAKEIILRWVDAQQKQPETVGK